MSIRVECPNPKCKKSLQAPDTHAGKKARCPGCGHIITIPDPDTVLVEAGADPLLGSRLGPLEIKERLGRGGMGAVYLATNTSLDRLVAVKVLPEELVRDDPTFLERFNREARMAAKLNHRNAVIIYSVGEDKGRHYIEMEFVQGMNLRQVIQKQERMELKEASRIIADAARALSAAHKQGIVHRDIKPDNIMLTEEGQVKVADFGLARVAATDSSITISGQVIGTPLYMSPEQGQGKPTDGRTDMYSLGATYYHALVGRVPFTADTPLQVMMKHVQEPVGWPADAENIPWDIRVIIEKMMAKNPADRYQDCDEVIHEIEEYFKPRAVVAQAVEEAVPVQAAVAITAAPKNAYVLSAQDLAAIESAGREIRHFTPTRRRKIGPKKIGTVPPSAGLSGLSPFSSKWLLPVLGLGLVVAVVVIAVAIKGRGGREHAQTSLGAAPGVQTTKGAKEKEPSGNEVEGPQVYETPAPAKAPSLPAISAGGQGKEATKPPETQIAECGELIFEDQFEGEKSQDWKIPRGTVEIANGALLIVGKTGEDRANINREFEVSVTDFVIELAFAKTEGNPYFQLNLYAGPGEKRRTEFQITDKWECLLKGGIVVNRNPPILCTKPCDQSCREFHVIFEKYGTTLALNVNGMCMTADCPDPPSQSRNLGITVNQGTIALDYIRVWKADPKRHAEVLQPGAYDDAYVATAATGEKIPHPLSRKTYKARYKGEVYEVPEGMAFVPAGPFIMGDNSIPDASPAHDVNVEAFFIDKYEVTNAQYMQFVKATGHWMPEHFLNNGGKIPEGRENHPVTAVGWEDARAYCDWCGKRLPTEAEWEKAASWNPGEKVKRKYPWGNEPPDSGPPRANWAGTWGFKPDSVSGDIWQEWSQTTQEPEKILALGGPTTPVGTFPAGMSLYGCYDMAGNVREYAQDYFDRYPGNTTIPEENIVGGRGQKKRTQRGGFWVHPADALRCANREGAKPSKRTGVRGGYGFRCALSAADLERWQGQKPEDASRGGAEIAEKGKKETTDERRLAQIEEKRKEKTTKQPEIQNPQSNPAYPRDQNYDDAFIQEVAALSPDQQVERVMARLKELNPNFDGNERHEIEDGHVCELDISANGITDISPVRALTHLSRFRCGVDARPNGNWVKGDLADLSPLKGLPLQEFSCHNTKVSDLSPLKGMPLKRLDVSGNPIMDLSPLRGMALERLGCDYTKVADLSPIAGMPLQFIGCSSKAAADVHNQEILRGMKTLENIGGWPVAEFWKQVDAGKTPLRHSQADEMGEAPASAAGVDDAFIQEVAALPPDQQVERVMARLKELNPGYDGAEEHQVQDGQVVGLTIPTQSATAIKNLSPIRALSRLQTFECCGHSAKDGTGRFVKAGFRDLEPFRGLPLVKLAISASQVSDLSPIKGMPLRELQSHHTPVEDLTPLQGMSLAALSINSTRITDLAPLEGMPLTYLDCSSTKVTDLSPLKGMPLTTLRLHNSKMLKDFSPLKGLPLQTLTCMPEVAAMPGNRDILRSIGTLERINGHPVAEFWRRVDAGERPFPREDQE